MAWQRTQTSNLDTKVFSPWFRSSQQKHSWIMDMKYYLNHRKSSFSLYYTSEWHFSTLVFHVHITFIVISPFNGPDHQFGGRKSFDSSFSLVPPRRYEDSDRDIGLWSHLSNSLICLGRSKLGHSKQEPQKLPIANFMVFSAKFAVWWKLCLTCK